MTGQSIRTLIIKPCAINFSSPELYGFCFHGGIVGSEPELMATCMKPMTQVFMWLALNVNWFHLYNYIYTLYYNNIFHKYNNKNKQKIKTPIKCTQRDTVRCCHMVSSIDTKSTNSCQSKCSYPWTAQNKPSVYWLNMRLIFTFTTAMIVR